MKIKFLTLLAASLFLFSCSTEETNEINNEDVNFTVNTNQNSNSGRNLNGGGGTGCPPVTCDPNYIFPEPDALGCYRNVYITYSSDLKPSEIPCVRQQYFECFAGLDLRFPPLQTLDPYEELWLIDCGKPGGGLETTICNDPRTNSECEN